jgi:glycosyltransferase involved in cell wall biosynthesis
MTIIYVAHSCNLSYINTELRYLLDSDSIREVRIFTDFPIEDLEVAFHDKCTVFVYGKQPKKVLELPRRGIIAGEILRHGLWYLKQRKWKELFLYSRDHMKKARFMLDQGIPDDAILYSFWAGSGAFINACLKRLGLKNMAITRLHAFDIYEDGDNRGHIPWRNFVLKQLNYFVTISEHGRHYLTRKYPYTHSRTRTITLGIPLKTEITNVAPEDERQIVSCSWAENRKNLTGVFDALRNLQNTTWTHLGDGEDFETLKHHVNRPASLKVKLPGRFTQQEISAFYRENPITCFISLSTNEGLPVSMMEAMAFGIPVVSTDVGGCAEIVTPETGVLLPKNYTNEDVLNAVNTCAEKFSSAEARKRIQEFIKANFDAEKNYRKFLDFLKEENTKHMSSHPQ